MASKTKLNFYLSFFHFFSILVVETLLFPILYCREFLFKCYSVYLNKKKGNLESFKFRIPVIKENVLNVCIHEWGGYNFRRKKQIRGREFECGLAYQITRFRNYTGTMAVNTTITISDFHLFKYHNDISDFKVIPVDNLAMDFSGYSRFVSNLPTNNCYILLTNSSISSSQVDFIDDYVAHFRSNPHLGMLGISFNSKVYQTFIKNNFNPHIQSFFILTTSNVLKGIVKFNGGYFPGSKSSYKLSIIRFGELQLSKIVLKMGYKIGVIKEDGSSMDFYRNRWYDNGYGRWKEPEGDCRLYVKHPNSINRKRTASS